MRTKTSYFSQHMKINALGIKKSCSSSRGLEEGKLNGMILHNKIKDRSAVEAPEGTLEEDLEAVETLIEVEEVADFTEAVEGLVSVEEEGLKEREILSMKINPNFIEVEVVEASEMNEPC